MDEALRTILGAFVDGIQVPAMRAYLKEMAGNEIAGWTKNLEDAPCPSFGGDSMVTQSLQYGPQKITYGQYRRPPLYQTPTLIYPAPPSVVSERASIATADFDGLSDISALSKSFSVRLFLCKPEKLLIALQYISCTPQSTPQRAALRLPTHITPNAQSPGTLQSSKASSAKTSLPKASSVRAPLAKALPAKTASVKTEPFELPVPGSSLATPIDIDLSPEPFRVLPGSYGAASTLT